MQENLDEMNESTYNGNVFLRLMEYSKPYKFQMALALVLVILITALELYKPQIIGQAIDKYIEGYNKPYAIVEKSDIEFDGMYLTHELDGADKFAQLVVYQDEYYLFKDLNKTQSDKLYKLSQDIFEVDQKTNDSITIDNLTAQLLSSDDLKVLRHSDFMGIVYLAIIYIIVTFLMLVLTYVQMITLQTTGQKIIYTIRNQLFEHVHSLPLRYFDTHPVGRIVTRITNDVESLHEMYAVILIRLFRSTIKIGGIAIVMMCMNMKLALISFIMVPIILYLTVIFRKIARRIQREIRTKLANLNTFLSENISGMRLIQIFANENVKAQEFEGKSSELYKSNMKQIVFTGVFRPLIFFISQFGLAILLFYGAKNVLDGVLTIGIIYIFINYFNSFFEPIQDLAEQFATLQNALASAEKIFTLLDEENPIVEKENPTKLDAVKGKIEFKHVWFAYDDEEYVLRDVSFVINPGEKVAFVGATGAGKSSILNLIGRYYDIQKGQILIDDVDIKDLSIKQIRDAIGQVQQDVFIFTGDIASNIRLLDDSISDETIEKSAKFVNAAGFIENLPNKYHETVSERGSTLSAGQRQLLSFARTLAYDPKILVMDEATANIDTETERLITEALEKLMDGRTTIMVAHRLSTIQHADKIIVMHKGKIRETGNHQELLKLDGIYKKLYELQLYSV